MKMVSFVHRAKEKENKTPGPLSITIQYIY